MIVHFVDIGGIGDHYCLIFLFIKNITDFSIFMYPGLGQTHKCGGVKLVYGFLPSTPNNRICNSNI
jgi:hypothetical protein